MRWPWRKAPDPLGEGVWRRAHDRFRRAVDRYHQVLEKVPGGAARDDLERTGARLAEALDAVHEVCVTAQRAAPSAGLDVPGGPWSQVHRSVSSAATSVAQAAEAAAMALVGAGPGQAAGTAAAARATDRVEQLVASARALAARG